MEEWRDVVRYEGIYQVSNKGQIKRISPAMGAKIGRILKPGVGTGYCQVTLYKNHNSHPEYIHKLVAESFISPRPKGKEINHKNGNKTDNRVKNLEWVTRAENIKHSYDILKRQVTRGEKNGKTKLTQQQIKEIRHLYATGKYWQRELADLFGVSTGAIASIVNFRTWKHIPGPKPPPRPRGERNHNAKLGKKDVLQIRRLYITGNYSHNKLAKMFNIAKSSIYYIVNRKTWRHI